MADYTKKIADIRRRVESGGLSGSHSVCIIEPIKVISIEGSDPPVADAPRKKKCFNFFNFLKNIL